MEYVRKWFEAKSEEIPGLGLVTALCSGLIALTLQESPGEFAIWLVASIWVVAYIFYQLGGVLDYVLFEPFYSAGKDLSKKRFPPLAKKLHNARQSAANKLWEGQVGSILGLYKTAEKLFGKSHDWDKKVKPLLNIQAGQLLIGTKARLF